MDMSTELTTEQRLENQTAYFDGKFMQLYVYDKEEILPDIEEFLDDDEKELAEGCSYIWHLSASGYTDCTHWHFAKTLDDIVDEVDMYYIEPYEC